MLFNWMPHRQHQKEAIERLNPNVSCKWRVLWMFFWGPLIFTAFLIFHSFSTSFTTFSELLVSSLFLAFPSRFLILWLHLLWNYRKFHYEAEEQSSNHIKTPKKRKKSERIFIIIRVECSLLKNINKSIVSI